MLWNNLTDDDCKCDHPPHFRGIALYPHQATVIQALLEIERTRSIPIETYGLDDITNSPVIVKTSDALLAEPLGSGKTIEILGLISHSQTPKPAPILVPVDTFCSQFKNSVEIRFRELLRPNLIVVCSAVLFQWKRTIEQYTSFRCYTISDSATLRKLRDNIAEINKYDVILIKSGVVTGSLVRELFPPNKVKNNVNILRALKKIVGNRCWSRVIYDDYDRLELKRVKKTYALFTIYVNSTYSHLCNNQYNINDVTKIPVTDIQGYVTYFKVRTNDFYSRISMSIPKINTYKYVINRTGNSLINAIGVVNGVDITEMLNGDAVYSAAKQLKITSTRVVDIFKKVLDDDYIIYQKCTRKLRDLPDIPKNIQRREKYKTHKEAAGRSISRIVDNLKEGECQICRLPLIDFDVVIVKCCGIVLCDVCGIKGNRIANEDLCGLCTYCKRPINAIDDLIFLSKEFNLNTIIDSFEKNDEDTAVQVDECSSEKSDVDTVHSDLNQKQQIFLKIYFGEHIENKRDFLININGLVTGMTDIPQPEGIPKKILLFANYDESLDNYVGVLTQHDVPFLMLRGTASMKSETVRKFESMETGVLLINSSKTCSGLNLQFVTDLVFSHCIRNSDAEAQVAGRAQRIGRKYNLNIHYLMYENENVW